MTPHLREIELVDALDGLLPSARRQHLDGCAECRERLDGLRHAVTLTGDDRVPEPSPLFWDHLSARVRDAIDREPPPSRMRWSWQGARAAGIVATATAAVVLLVAAGGGRVGNLDPSDPVPAPQALAGAAVHELPIVDAPLDLDQDEAWALVRTVADELETAEITAAGIATRPGSAERVANQLSEAERVELAALLEREIKAGAARVPSS
jgi:hypothetical protein